MIDERCFGFLMGRVRQKMRREFEESAAHLDITIAQFLILHRLWAGDGILTSVLTREASSDGGTVTGLLDRLESKGLIRRARSETDRRAVHIWLTGAGRDLEVPVLQIIAEVNEKALAGFSDEQKSTLFEFLGKVEKNLDA